MSRIGNAGQDRDRSQTIEAVTFLTDAILVRKNDIPLEEMCNEDGEFLNHYQEQFNRLYDRIENILLNMNKQNQKTR
uniref:RteC protein n=1 Tax=Prevotella sp. GTC17253 TaxID=3236793 RepID=A0AB33IML2_9BACT